MSLKKHIAMAMVTGLLGMAMISGGTVAYFSDSIESKSQIMSGSLKLGMENEEDDEKFYFNFKNKQPGDVFDPYTFKLSNDGSLPIGELSLLSSYKAKNKNGEPTDFGRHIVIHEIKVNGKTIDSLKGKSLHKIDSQKNKAIIDAVLATRIGPEEEVEIEVTFKFAEGENQNSYQENTLELTWIFEATQHIEEIK